MWDSDTQSLDEIYGAAAPAGGAFGEASVIETLGQGPGNPELDVNASGAAILVYGDANEDCTGDCSIFRLEARYGSASGTFSPSQNITNTTSGHSFTTYDAAIDDEGVAAILFNGGDPDGFHMFGRVSSAAGSFSGVPQTISGPARGLDDNIEIAAGGGEFTAVWISSGDATTEDVLLRAHTQDGVFQAPHQLSQPSTTDSADGAHVARNNRGDYIAGWSLFSDDLHALVAPTNADTVNPRVTGVADSPDPLRRGRLTIRFTPSEDVKATVAIKNARGRTVATVIRGKLIRGDVRTTVRWSGKIGGRRARPGRYAYTISVVDAAGNRGSARGSFRVR